VALGHERPRPRLALDAAHDRLRKAIGLRRIHGQVLAENTTMLRMCHHLGFHIGDDPSSRDIKVGRWSLWKIPRG